VKSFASLLLNNGGIYRVAPYLCTGGEHTNKLLASTEVKVNEDDEDDDDDAEEGAAAAFAIATFVVLGFVTVGTLTMLNVLVMLSKLAVIAVVCRLWMRYCHLKRGIEFRKKHCV
jgi:Flp pilus assembly protein TadB